MTAFCDLPKREFRIPPNIPTLEFDTGTSSSSSFVRIMDGLTKSSTWSCEDDCRADPGASQNVNSNEFLNGCVFLGEISFEPPCSNAPKDDFENPSVNSGDTIEPVSVSFSSSIVSLASSKDLRNTENLAFSF
jgi:hypothetical protein